MSTIPLILQPPAAPAAAQEDKQALRRRIRALRAQLPPEERMRLSRQAAGFILACPAWHEAQAVGLYVPVRGETATELLLDAAWQQKKKLLLPRVSRHEPGHMEFIPCPDAASMVPGAYGIMEPDPDLPCVRARAQWLPQLLIVPGVAFDTAGTRLGSGGGYYDRYCSRPALAGVPRIALAYAFQVYAALPREPWDMPMHALCTEQGLTWLAHPVSVAYNT